MTILDMLLFSAIMLVMTIVVSCIAKFVFWAIDSWFRPKLWGPGVVINKHFKAAHTTITTVMVDKTMVPQIHEHPAVWSIYVQFIDGFGDWVNVDQELYNATTKGSRVLSEFSSGRLNQDNCYIHQVRLNQEESGSHE